MGVVHAVSNFVAVIGQAVFWIVCWKWVSSLRKIAK
jgi:hypothetical protein